jgi:phosphoserine phosphatase RsbU/P
VFDELINNVISYGLSKDSEQSIQVGIALYGNRLVIEIEDGGIPFNPFMRADPNTEASLDEREIGGLGIHLVKELMDEVSYNRAHDKNRVTLVKQLH